MKTMTKLMMLLALVCMLACSQDATEPDSLLTDAVAGAPEAIPKNCPPAIYKSVNFMRYIPRGEFVMGNAAHPETPEIKMYVEHFWIDMNKVTHGEFMFFMDMTGYQPAHEYSVEFYDPDEYSTHINPAYGANMNSLPAQVSYFDALAYAEWVGKRLPTEMEWEKAARGGIEGARYPWGHEHPTLAEDSKQFFKYRNGGGAGRTGLANEGAFALRTLTGGGTWEFRPVASYAPNPFGLFDMMGNGAEWCSDKWNANAYLLLANGIIPDYDPNEFNQMHVVRNVGMVHNLKIVDTEVERQTDHWLHVAKRAPGLTIDKACFRLAMDGVDDWNDPDAEFVDLDPWANCKP